MPRRKGADAVIAINIDTGTINVDQKGDLFLIIAAGTAVKFQEYCEKLLPGFNRDSHRQ